MKRGKRMIFAALLAAILVACTGCDAGNTGIGSKPLAPYVLSFGELLSWESVEDASSYDVYCDGTLLASVEETSYRAGEMRSDARFFVVAKNAKRQSDKSNEVLVSKNTDYQTDEILDLSGYSTYGTTVSSSVRKIILGKSDATRIISLSLTISARSTDLVFELNSVAVQGQIVTQNGSYSRVQNDYSVIFHLNGDCSIRGKDGEAGFDYSSSQYDNSEMDAGKGGDGKDAVVAPTVVVKGNGNFIVAGGNGGNGGIGSGTTKWEATMGPGTGSDGGNGGAGAKTSYFVLDMDSGNCTATVTDGMGGKKGSPGRNSSIITGPMVSMMWNDIYDIGKYGTNGQSILGTRKIINGMLNAN